MMMSFAIGGPRQQAPALPQNLTQNLGLPNFTSQYGSGLAQDLRGQLFLFTGNAANSPLIETMAYSQLPNFTLPVSQFTPNNPLNTSIDSLFNAPVVQNGGLAMAAGRRGSIFAPQQSTQQGFPTFPPQRQQAGFQQIPQQQQQNRQPVQLGGNTVGQVIAGLQQQIFELQSLLQRGGVSQPQQGGIQSLVSPVDNGMMSQQQSLLQTLSNPMTVSQLTSPIDATFGGQSFMKQSTMQGYDGMGQQQQQQYNPYLAQGGYPPYATAGGQIVYQ